MRRAETATTTSRIPHVLTTACDVYVWQALTRADLNDALAVIEQLRVSVSKQPVRLSSRQPVLCGPWVETQCLSPKHIEDGILQPGLVSSTDRQTTHAKPLAVVSASSSSWLVLNCLGCGAWQMRELTSEKEQEAQRADELKAERDRARSELMAAKVSQPHTRNHQRCVWDRITRSAVQKVG